MAAPRSPIFEIEIQGALPAYRRDWFEGLEILPQENGNTILLGALPDQAALHGVIEKIRDLGIALIGIKKIE